MDADHTPISHQNETSNLKAIDGGIDTTDPLKPYVAKHRCQYDCSFLDHPLLYEKTAKDIAYTIALRMTRLTSQKGNVRHRGLSYLRKFFFWLFKYLDSGKRTEFKQIVKNNLATGEMPARDDWQRVIDAFRSTAVKMKGNPFHNTENKHTLNLFLSNVRVFLKLCATRGIFPAFLLKGIKGAVKHCGKRKSLGDLKNRHINEQDIERLIGGYLQDCINEHDIIEEERKACIHALASSGLDITGLSDAEIIEEIKQFNKTRLVEVRRCAEADFLRAWEVFQEGQRLLEGCDLSYEGDMREPLEDLLKGLAEGIHARNFWSTNHPFRAMFSGEIKQFQVTHTYKRKGNAFERLTTCYRRGPLPKETALARLLTLLVGRFGMAPPWNRSIAEKVVEESFRMVWKQNNLGYNYKFWPAGRIGGTVEALLAAQIILMVDTGLNTEVIDQLTIDCVKDTDEPAIKTVWGIKKRAGGKVVNAQVLTNDPGHKISSIEVIRKVEEMTRRLRKIASEGHPLFKVKYVETGVKNKLFIRQVALPGKVEGKTVALASGLFKATFTAVRDFKNRHPSVGAYDFALSNIRPTVKLLRFMECKDIEISRAESKHSSINTTSGYVVRTLSRMAMEQRIREFQKTLEAIMIFDIPGAAEKLGYTTEEYTERLVKAERTGLGTICDHLRKGNDGQDISNKRKNCDPIEDCPECPLMRVFPALKENLVDAFLTRNWILENESELKSHNPTRWDKVWLRWRAITEGVIDKAKTSHAVSRTTLNEAEKLASQLGDDGFLPLI